MTILEGEKAVQYLQRARSCLHPEKDSFSGMQMLAKMLDIEISYLGRLKNTQGAGKLVQVCIDSTGFPELKSWVVDINQALSEFDATRIKRTKALLPLLQEFSNASPGGISREFENIAAVCGEDEAIADTFSGVSEKQREYFASFSDGSLDAFIMRKHLYTPGILSYITMHMDLFYAHHYERLMGRGNGYLGFKYIDSAIPAPTPKILVWGLEETGELSFCRILEHGYPLVNRCYQAESRACSCGFDNHPVYFIANPLPETSDVLPDTDMELKLLHCNEEMFSSLHPAAKKFLACVDAAQDYPDPSLLFRLMPVFDSYLKDLIGFFDSVKNDPANMRFCKVQSLAQSLPENLNAIMNLASSDTVRELLQIAMAECLQGARGQMKEIIEGGQRAKALQDAGLPQLALPEPKLQRKKWFGII